MRIPFRGTIARLAISCNCPDTGIEGTFLFTGESHRNEGSRISPIFPSLYELCGWMRTNGWKEVGGAYTYAP
jgi:hypothetical protein